MFTKFRYIALSRVFESREHPAGQARFDAQSGTTTLQLQLRNCGSTTLTGPISLVLIGLPRGIKLLSRTGITVTTPKGLPFQNVRLGPVNRAQVTASGAVVISLGGNVHQLLAGEVRPIQLVFKNLAGKPFRFHWRVLAGNHGIVLQNAGRVESTAAGAVELNTISAAVLIIGDAASGAMTVSGGRHRVIGFPHDGQHRHQRNDRR